MAEAEGREVLSERPVPEKPAVTEQWQYDFDNWYCTSPSAPVTLLMIANVIAVFVLAILFGATGSLASTSGIGYYAEMCWMAWGQLSGTGGSPDGELWGTRAATIINAFLAMFVFALVCAFVEQLIEDKKRELRRGNTKVLEDEFVLVIGWTDRILPLVQQLCLAFESDGGGKIVILADKDKIDMDDFMMGNLVLSDRLGTSIITRAGNPVDTWDLEKVSARQAKTIIVLADPLNPEEATAGAIRTMLALMSLGTPFKGGINGALLLEVYDAENVGYATENPDGNEDIYGDVLHTIVPDAFTGKLMIQCAMEPGLCRVFSHILAFEMNEFYFKEWPSLVRRKFADICFMFEDAVPFGVKLAHPGSDGVEFLINPPGDYVIENGDEILVIAEDDNTYSPGDIHLVDAKRPPEFEEPEPEPMQILVVGFRPDIAAMLNEIEKWVAKGSRLLLFCEEPIQSRMMKLIDNGLAADKFENMTMDNREGNPLVLADVEELKCHTYQATIILAEQRPIGGGEFENPLDVDSRVLVTSVMIRGIQRTVYGMDARSKCTNVAEILDKRSLNLMRASRLNDWVCVNDMVAMALAQVAMCPDILKLIEEMFKPDGSEMHIKDIRLYAHEGESLNWWELVARARLRAHVALGYIQQSVDAFIPPVLNPEDKMERITWRMGDKLVVFSED